MTNLEKFRRIFGFTPDTSLKCEIVSKAICKKYGGDCLKCPYDNWWNRSYKPKPKKTVDEALTESLDEWGKAQQKGWYN